MTPWLTKEELDDLCAPLKQAAAQIRFLRSLGLTVKTKPNGTPLVIRSHFEQIMNPGAAQKPVARTGPNREALIEHFQHHRPAKKKSDAPG